MQYNKNLEKLQESTGNVIVEKANETIKLKESYQKGKEFFEQRYDEFDAENKEIRREKEKLQLELNSAKSEFENLNGKFSRLQEQFQQVQNSLIKANEQISSLIAGNQELCRKLKEKGGEC